MPRKKKPANQNKETPVESTKEPQIKSAPKPKKRQGVFIKVKGTYYGRDNRGKIIKEYDDEMQLTDDPNREMPREPELLRLLQKKLAPVFFKQNKKYPDFTGLRTLHIMDTSVEGAKNTKPKVKTIDQMGIEELALYAASEDLMCDVDKFPTINEARKAVFDELEDRKIAEREEQRREEEEEFEEEVKYKSVEDLVEFGAKVEA